MSDKISYEDIKPYEKLFTATPAFLLERFAKRKTNFVLKFKSKVESFLDGKGTVFLGHTNVSKTYHFITNFP